MKNYRLSGKSPYRIILLHGGPGAWGEMKPVADFFQEKFGIIESFQTQAALTGQLQEIYNIIKKYAHPPVILIGFSWGAWLGYLFCAKYGQKTDIAKLILIGSGPYRYQYYKKLLENRAQRMTLSERNLSEQIFNQLKQPDCNHKEKDELIRQLGNLYEKIDNHAPETQPSISGINFPSTNIDRSQFFQRALNEIMDMRKSGDLLQYGKKIQCPVVAIHGRYDPHPWEGVVKPLQSIVPDFRYHLLSQCGHKPWIELHAKDNFYAILKQEIHNSYQIYHP